MKRSRRTRSATRMYREYPSLTYSIPDDGITVRGIDESLSEGSDHETETAGSPSSQSHKPRLQTIKGEPGDSKKPDDILVAVMGMTGSGKSTFISLCTGEDVEIGHQLQACTQTVSVYRCRRYNGPDIYLVDTPGFDDTYRSDADVLKEIASWLTKSYTENKKLSGILYLHRITDTRMTGSAKRNLFMFKKLCGTSALGNVLLVSTMWEGADLEAGKKKERELIDTRDFWGALVEKGATVKRHHNIRESAMDLLETLVQKKNKVVMSIQEEMVEENKRLDQTAAGQGLHSVLEEERENFRRKIEEIQDEIKQALQEKDQESAEQLLQVKEETEVKLKMVMADTEKLKVSLERMHAEQLAEVERKFNEENGKLKAQLKRVEKKVEAIPMVTDRDREIALIRVLNTHSTFVRAALAYLLWPADLSKVVRKIKNPVQQLKWLIMGTNSSWYCHYQDDKGNPVTKYSDSLQEYYPALVKRFEKKRYLSCPSTIALGSTGCFFITCGEKSACELPPALASSEAKPDRKRPCKSIWLGAQGTWIIHFKSGGWEWNIKGYPSLDAQMASYVSTGIRAISLNQDTCGWYVSLINGRRYCGHQGSIQAVKIGEQEEIVKSGYYDDYRKGKWSF